MDKSFLFFVVGLLFFVFAHIETRPSNRMVYDIFKVSEDNCSSKIGVEVNTTLYDSCMRILPDLVEIQTDPRKSSLLNEVLKCIGALYNLKYNYCPNNKDSIALDKYVKDNRNVKLNEFCAKSRFTLSKENNAGVYPDNWITLLKEKLSLSQNCSLLCRDSVNIDQVDYFCILTGYNNFTGKPVTSSKNVTSGIEEKPVVSSPSNNQVPVSSNRPNEPNSSKTQATFTKVKVPEETEVNSYPASAPQVNVKDTVKTVEHPKTISGMTVEQVENQVPSDQNLETLTNMSADQTNNNVVNEVPGRNSLEEMSGKNTEPAISMDDPQDKDPSLNDSGVDEEKSKEPANARMVGKMNEYGNDYAVEEDSNFFVYFIFMIVMTAFGYMAFHNKNKLIALVVEGRRSRSRSRSGGRHSTTSYSKLHSNLEETMTSSTAPSSTHVLY